MEAVDAAKSGGQEFRVGEAFVEYAGKTGFPVFWSIRKGDNCALRGESGSQRGKCNSPDQRMTAGYILTDIREPKWKSRIENFADARGEGTVAAQKNSRWTKEPVSYQFHVGGSGDSNAQLSG